MLKIKYKKYIIIVLDITIIICMIFKHSDFDWLSFIIGAGILGRYPYYPINGR